MYRKGQEAVVKVKYQYVLPYNNDVRKLRSSQDARYWREHRFLLESRKEVSGEFI